VFAAKKSVPIITKYLPAVLKTEDPEDNRKTSIAGKEQPQNSNLALSVESS
jgi:hypothetical protein